jgi:hypothetical protein
MALTLDRLKELVEGEDLKYFIAPDRPAVMMGFGGLHGRYQVIVKSEVDGRFLQFRTISYLSCPADHSNIDAVLRVMGHLNYQLRLAKFGWDPDDGEIVVYADMWVEDGDPTQEQFKAMLRTFLPAMDLNHPRLQKTIETGVDPGESSPDDIGSKMKDFADELDTMKKKKGDDDDDDDGDDFSVI